ncbi:MAG: type II toxin-antitoxin system VapC family toxin [Nanoarchaeota archaeon]|nr:type II toxin-antitoxin system VapC family toxin [Nanoarchaeota archaeon]
MKYIDSSVFAKCYADEKLEKGADKAREEIEKARQGEEILVSSILLIGEVVSIFDKWYRRHILSEEELREQLSLFVEDIIELTNNGGLILEPISPLIFISSIKFITQYHISVGDAIHLYTALMYLPRNEEFVCSDRNLNYAAREERFVINDPEE